MAFSSFRLSARSLPHFTPPRKLLHEKAELSLLVSSSLPTPRPGLRRKNHLRPKLPNPQPPSNPAPSSPSEPIESSSFASASSLLIAEEADPAEESLLASETVDAFPPSAAHLWFTDSVLSLAARFAALLAVQTAVAVWFLGREEFQEAQEERRDRDGSDLICNESDKADWKDNRQEKAEFEKMVLQIREMAREAREREAAGIKNKEKVGKGVVGQKKSISWKLFDEEVEDLIAKNDTSKLKFRVGDGYLPKARGFKGLRRVDGESGLSKGGMQQIVSRNPRESTKLCEPRKSDAQSSGMTQKSCEKMSTAESAENLPNFNKQHNSSQRKQSKRDSETSVSNNSTKADIKESQKEISCRQNTISESLVEKKKYSMSLTETNDRPQGAFQNKETSSIPVVDRDKKSISGSQEKEVKKWWQSLPYVFGILLHRGSRKNGDIGLYSLKLNSTSHEGNQPSCAIAFQDRGDATNFSFLLESFFEDLGDVSANVVPLTIPELGEAIRHSELQLIVVRKGQLHLYAGQPLADVETALCSLLE